MKEIKITKKLKVFSIEDLLEVKELLDCEGYFADYISEFDNFALNSARKMLSL